MKFISIRDFRKNAAKTWDDLAEAREIVITNSGKPFAILTYTTADTVENSLRAIRQAKAKEAVENMQLSSVKNGLDSLTAIDIDEEIKATRVKRKK